jgi:DMSO/TMAO reductase YedYZ heme-binding membrane subunit
MAFILLIPLAATSTNSMIRRLGGRTWKRLHSVIYIVATLVIFHFLWLVKADIREPLIYGIILLGLLALRSGRESIPHEQTHDAYPGRRRAFSWRRGTR